MPPLLLDHNLSPRLQGLLRQSYPDIEHVAEVGLDRADDRRVWRYAKQSGRVIVTKDSDFNDLASLHEPPPHVVWVRKGNVPTRTVAEALDAHASAIRSMVGSPLRVLVLT